MGRGRNPATLRTRSGPGDPSHRQAQDLSLGFLPVAGAAARIPRAGLSNFPRRLPDRARDTVRAGQAAGIAVSGWSIRFIARFLSALRLRRPARLRLSQTVTAGGPARDPWRNALLSHRNL